MNKATFSKIKLPCAAWHKSSKTQRFSSLPSGDIMSTYMQFTNRKEEVWIPRSLSFLHPKYYSSNTTIPYNMLRTTEMRIPNAFASDCMFEKLINAFPPCILYGMVCTPTKSGTTSWRGHTSFPKRSHNKHSRILW